MLRPWNVGEFGTCEEDHYSLGCTAWRRRLPTPRVDEAPGSASNAPRAPALTLAQKRKLSNLFAEVRAAAGVPHGRAGGGREHVAR